MFEIESEQFTGPLELLLELIEAESLSISEVSLAHVTESYLEHIEKNEPPPDELADFLIVATRLLLIKSRLLLPDPIVEDEDTSDLAAQLKMFKAFVELSVHLEKQFNASFELFPREKADTIKILELVIPEGLTIDAMRESFAKLLKNLEPFFNLKQVALERVVSVKERFDEIREAIMQRARFTFQDILGNGRSKVDTVISFLALLELVKQRVVHVVQGSSFEEIEIKRVD
ncbi:MAG: segregation/condensation protein A [Patescibacteria group bacterium]